MSKDEMDKMPVDEKTAYRPQFGHLGIPGAFVGSIEYCSDQLLDLTDVKQLKSLLSQWFYTKHKSDITQTDIGTLRTLVFYLKFVSGEFKRLEGVDETHLQAWFEAKTSSDNQVYQDILGFNYVLKFMSARRRFFLTHSIALRWGPDGLKAYDEVYVLPGGKTPYVLRRVSWTIREHTRRQQLLERWARRARRGREAIREMEMIGDCYVHGAMDGECLNLSNMNGQATIIVQEDCMHELFEIERLFKRKFDDILSEYVPDIRERLNEGISDTLGRCAGYDCQTSLAIWIVHKMLGAYGRFTLLWVLH
ncbi:hypothetical protein F5Y00DRAFT_267883 [Daldinia vernicosa]|uniref:uncharacterized protein n=1 Tax=Daldinia vernicosa TaxID=114800 RepID=UPI002008329C|nr:uncharacterized protein F5Y00DRAFT_267883 [Daldinia vernicosa]KAI0851192.1 hypothetical protein F5Y00DRAFT_267883 [Daldinia vernicosa]